MEARGTQFMSCYGLCSFGGSLFSENWTLPKWMFAFADHTIWRGSDGCFVLVNRIAPLTRFFSWCWNFSAGFCAGGIRCTAVIELPLPLDIFIRLCPSAFSFNHSLKSICVCLIQFSLRVCVDHACFILGRSLERLDEEAKHLKNRERNLTSEKQQLNFKLFPKNWWFGHRCAF